MDWFWPFIIAATWRLSSLFARENGPFDIFVRIRKFIYTRTLYNSFSGLFLTINNGLSCLWCNSIWFSALMVIPMSRSLYEWFVNCLAISTFVIILDGVIEWLGHR